MGLIDKINWRSPLNVLALFCILAGIFFTSFAAYQWYKPDPPPATTVSLTPEQAAEIRQPLQDFFQTLYDRNAAVRKAELRQALQEDHYNDSAYRVFLLDQNKRNEKYNSAATAAPAELMREWSNRYDR